MMLFLKLTIVVIIFWNLQIFLKMKRKVIVTNKNGKYELADELPNKVRLKKISKHHGVIA